jgi:aminoglycoside 2'-N-acetyltransferase I
VDSGVQPPRLRRLPTSALTSAEIAAVRSNMRAAFGSGEDAFSEDDWAHSLGGLHFILDVDGEIVTHASVVERELHVGDRPLRTGYVEAVATAPGRQGRGFGTLVMEAVTAHIRETFELGALGTGRHHFYERLGWRTWAGPAFVRTPDGPRRTPDDEGYILVLRTPTSPVFELTEPISCDWRPGDAW